MVKKWPFLYIVVACGVIIFNGLIVNTISGSFTCPTCDFYDRLLLMGTVQYPTGIERVPILRVYCGGNKIKCEINNENKKLTFTIPGYRNQSCFYLLITEMIEFVSENNVVLYLKIPTNFAYKLYELQVVRDEPTKGELPEGTNNTGKSEQQKAIYRWKSIKEIRLADNGRIPDNAIILCDNPEHIFGIKGGVAGVEGGTAYELPTIVMRDDLLELAGSEKKLHELSNRLVLASLDYDTIHASVPQMINQKTAKTIVALTT